MRGSKARAAVLCAMFAAMMSAAAYIKIPVSVIPVTMQTAVMMLSGSLLGGNKGAASMIIYILLGLMGLPVFSGGGGISYIFSPTFGYILGFVVGAYITGSVCQSSRNFSYKRILAGNFLGLAAVYIIGIVYCALIIRFYLGQDIVWRVLLVNCLLLTVPIDIVLAVLSALLSKRLSNAIAIRASDR